MDKSNDDGPYYLKDVGIYRQFLICSDGNVVTGHGAHAYQSTLEAEQKREEHEQRLNAPVDERIKWSLDVITKRRTFDSIAGPVLLEALVEKIALLDRR